VFGILKRQGKIYTQVVKNCSAKELLPIILEHAKTDSRIFLMVGNLMTVWWISAIKTLPS